MRLQDLHTHSRFDDGAGTLEQMVRSARRKGLSAIGLSAHSPIRRDVMWTMQEPAVEEYLSECARLREKYQGKIQVFCGIELDLRSNMDLSPFDYVLGSNHAIFVNDTNFDVDDSPQVAWEGIQTHFGGDCDRAAEVYFSQYHAIAENSKIDIVSHFDLLTKFDERAEIYHPESPRFQKAAKEAMEELVAAGKIFEVNTGGIARGYRSIPYPTGNLLPLLYQMGGKICLSSDAHAPHTIAYAFPETIGRIKAAGFRSMWVLTANGFAEETL